MLLSHVLALAPDDLRNRRKGRYLGDDLWVPLSVFTKSDQRRIVDCYGFLQTLMGLTSASARGDEKINSPVCGFLESLDLQELLQTVQELGKESYAALQTELMAKTIHDLRGGGLSSLMGNLQLLKLRQLANLSTAECLRLFFLTRDHLKIMRNAVVGLDDEKRNEDLTPKMHGTDLLVQKWQDADLGDASRRIEIKVECLFDGHIAECCVEFGALDRVLYNLINNAQRHSASHQIQLFLLPIPQTNPANLRFALFNKITPKDLAYLERQDLRELFSPGKSTTGSAFGLTVAADFVSNAFGLSGRQAALEESYLGARLVDGGFAVWFHWPLLPEF